ARRSSAAPASAYSRTRISRPRCSVFVKRSALYFSKLGASLGGGFFWPPSGSDADGPLDFLAAAAMTALYAPQEAMSPSACQRKSTPAGHGVSASARSIFVRSALTSPHASAIVSSLLPESWSRRFTSFSAVAREGLDGGELHLPAGGPFRADLPEERRVELLPGDRLLGPIVSLHDGRDGEIQGRLAGKVARRADREP